MTASAAAVYGALLHRPAPVGLLHDDGHLLPLALDRWLGVATAADEHVLATAAGPVLDVGCGPGRLLEALARRDVPALGVDRSPVAVALARRRGGDVLRGCIFGAVPAGWGTALLVDGNIGIGGDPVALLARLAALLAPGGRVVAELEAPGTGTRAGTVRLRTSDLTSGAFPWARVGIDDAARVAAGAGLAVRRREQVDGRWFAWLGA